MFKKHVSVQQRTLLSGKDSKQLKRTVAAAFPSLSGERDTPSSAPIDPTALTLAITTDEDLEHLLPGKADIQLFKLNTGALVYLGAGQPLFFDPSGKGDKLFPTVYALWEVPEGRLLKPIYTHSLVSPKVLGGADLFLQGFILPPEGLGNFLAGETRSISIPENAYPFAVGTFEVSAAEVRRDGLKGKGLRLIHTYSDLLWELGDRSTPGPEFTPTQIHPQAAGPAFKLRGGAGDGGEAPAGEPEVEETAGRLEAASLEEGREAASQPASTAEVDQILDKCLLTALHNVPDSDLPLLTSELQARFLVPLLTTGVELKKSSYKKLSKLLTKFEKKGVLSQKVVFKQDKISAIHRANETYLAHTPSGLKGRVALCQAAMVPQEVHPPPGAKEGGTGRGVSAIEVNLLYRVPVSLRPVFAAAEKANKDALFTGMEARAQLLAYAERERLTLPSGQIKLDHTLHGALFNKKEVAPEGTPWGADDLHTRLLSKLTTFHQIRRQTPQGVVESVRRGAVKGIEVRVEERQGGRKHITRITHVESLALDPDELGAALQKHFQTACAISKMAGKMETDKELALQGDLSKKLVDFLRKEYGVEKQFVEFKKKGQ